MNDQAQHLRNKVDKVKDISQSRMKIITITSGKGGVGKSNFSTNLAIALANHEKKPIILDADFGLSNVEIIYGQRPAYHMMHLMNNLCTLEELITPTPYGVSFISGGSGIKEMLFLDNTQLNQIGHTLAQLEQLTDLVIIDTGAGINEIVLKFSEMADEVYVIVTPEPASITDAYALIKTVVKDFKLKPKINIVINKANDKEEAHEVYKKISYVSKQFLNIAIDYAGYIPYDPKLFEAVKKQKPVIVYDPQATSSRAYQAIARNLLNLPQQMNHKIGWKEKFISVFSKSK